MIRLTVDLLAISVFTPTVFAQTFEWLESGEHPQHRFRILSDWLEMVKGAESVYKNKNGRYGDVAVLRKAHLLDRLVFETGSSADASDKAEATFVPKSTLFQVTVSEDGQHFKAVIREHCVSVNADDHADDMGVTRVLGWVCGPSPRDIEDSPEGPIISVAR